MKKSSLIFIGLGVFIAAALIIMIASITNSNKKISGNETSNLTSEESYEWEGKLNFFNKSYEDFKGYFNKSEIDSFTTSVLEKINITNYQFNGYIVIVNHTQKIVKIPEEGDLYGVSLNFTYLDGKKIRGGIISLSEYNVVATYTSRIIGLQEIPENYSNVSFCYKESDCIMTGNDCCASANCNFKAINKKYSDFWSSQFNCSGMGCIASICMKTFYTECIDSQCALIEDICFDNWQLYHNGIVFFKFKENISKSEIEKVLKPIDEIEPKLNYRIKFPFDIYTFKLSKEKTDYACNYEYIWCYVEAADKFIAYLNKNPNINAFITGYEVISLVVNNEEMDRKEVLEFINSYNDTIHLEDENLSAIKGLYGLYVSSLFDPSTARYICDNVENNKNIISIERMYIWLQELKETIGSGCTNRESFFPLPDFKKC